MTPMVVQCSSCLTEFELDPNKVPAAGVRARCSVCSAVITVPAPHVAAPQRAEPQRAEPQRGAPERAVPEHRESERQAPQAADTATTTAKESPSTPAEPPKYAAQPAPPAPVAAEAAPAAPEAASAAVSTADSVMGSSWAVPKPSVAPAVSPVEPDGGQRRPINPFLTRDPALRAKRLARALVSDIVAYHPARHAEGLRDGTLKTLFRDEIKKSYEEYVDQVGRDFAGSTTHFQDALNDVLASGKKLF